MERLIKSDYISIYNHNVYLEKSMPTGGLVIENATLMIVDNILTITGSQVVRDFTFSRKWISDIPLHLMPEAMPEDKYIKKGPRTILDFILGVKQEYVEDSYVIKQRVPFESMMTDWTITK